MCFGSVGSVVFLVCGSGKTPASLCSFFAVFPDSMLSVSLSVLAKGKKFVYNII